MFLFFKFYSAFYYSYCGAAIKFKIISENTNKLFVFFVSCQIEELGSEGRVEEAQGMMKLVEQLKEEREQLSSTPSVSFERLSAALASTASVFGHRSP